MVWDMVIPSTIRAFMLFRRAEVDDDIRRDLKLSKLDYEHEETLKEVLGGGLGTRKRPQHAIEILFVTEESHRFLGA